MIWRNEEPLGRDVSALQADFLRRVEIAAGREETGPACREAARAVAFFCLRDSGVRRWEEGQLALWMAQALRAAGEAGMARDCLEHHVDRGCYVAGLLNVGCVRGTRARLKRFGPGREWASLGSGVGWVLDLALGDCGAEALLEMEAWAALRQGVRELAGLWDEARGKGWLGVRGLKSLGRRVLGVGAGSIRIAAICLEMLAHVRGALEAEGRRRGWAERPRVVWLEA